MLKMIDFLKSPSQHPKSIVPSLPDQVLEPQQRLSRWTISNKSCPTPCRFSHQTILMALLNIEFRKSPIQPPKTTLPGPKNYYFETQHRWSRWTVFTNLLPNPSRFSHKKVSILVRKLITSCANHIFLTVHSVIVKNSIRDEQFKKVHRMQSNVNTNSRRYHLYSTVIYLLYLLIHWQCTRDKKWTIPYEYIWREKSCPYIYIFADTFIWLISHFVTADTRPAFQWNVDVYVGRIHIYIMQLCIWLIFWFTDSHDHWAR